MKRLFLFFTLFFLPALHAMGDSSRRISVAALLNPLGAPRALPPATTPEPAGASAADEAVPAVQTQYPLPSTIIDLLTFTLALEQIPESSRAAVARAQREVQSAGTPQYKFWCPQCSRMFTSKGQFYEHQLTYQADYCEHPASHCQCGYCFKKMQPSSVYEHQRICHTPKRFMCVVCQKRFLRRRMAEFHPCRGGLFFWHNESHPQ